MYKIGINYKTVFQSMPGCSVLISNDNNQFIVLTISEAYQKAMGKEGTVIEGEDYLELIKIDSNNENLEQELKASFEFVMSQKKQHSFFIKHFPFSQGNHSNHPSQWHISNKPLMDENGVVQTILHTITESITYPLVNEDKKSTDFSASFDLFLQAPVAICIVKGPDYIVELANEGMLQYLGRTTAMVGKPIIESLPEARLQGLIAVLDHVRHSGQSFHIPNFPATILINGIREERYLNLMFKPYFQQPAQNEPTSIFCVAHDITAQILNQKRIEESEEKYRTLFTTMDQGFCILEMIFNERGTPVDYRFLEINPVFEQQTGLKDAIGKTARELVPNLEPHWFQLYGNVAITGESVRFLEGSAAMGRWFEVNAFRLGGADSKKVALLFTDITQRKQNETQLEEKVRERTVELESLYNELKRSNVNLEEFAYAASHDLKEPIRKIHYFSDRLKGELQEGLSQNQLKLFHKLELASQRMANLIDDLLAYSQTSMGSAEQEIINLQNKLSNVLEDLELEIQEKNATIETEELPVIKGNRRQFQQLFQNLISNALKYSKPHIAPHIKITSRKVKGNETNCAMPAERGDELFYLIGVQDNGIGFDPADAERIFNVFTRLHGNMEYRGTGVGLSIVRKVVENHDGFVWAQSKPDKGATFYVLLPAG